MCNVKNGDDLFGLPDLRCSVLSEFIYLLLIFLLINIAKLGIYLLLNIAKLGSLQFIISRKYG